MNTELYNFKYWMNYKVEKLSNSISVYSKNLFLYGLGNLNGYFGLGNRYVRLDFTQFIFVDLLVFTFIFIASFKINENRYNISPKTKLTRIQCNHMINLL